MGPENGVQVSHKTAFFLPLDDPRGKINRQKKRGSFYVGVRSMKPCV